MIIALALPLYAHAAVINLEHPTSVDLREQFTVDALLDTEGATINGIESSIRYSIDTLRLVRVEDGESIVSLWIESPQMGQGTTSFSGIIPNGFAGFIDPFDPSVRKPGKLVRLVFESIAPGTARIISSGSVAAGDGDGTITPITSSESTLTVSSVASNKTYTITDTIAPVLQAQRVHEPDLYNGDAVLVFSATDAQSGVWYVEVREQNGEWKRISSPYRLEDQSDSATLEVRAVDYAGNTTIVRVGTQATSRSVTIAIIALLIFAFPIMVLLYKRYAYKT
jgi:hypothetical protein